MTKYKYVRLELTTLLFIISDSELMAIDVIVRGNGIWIQKIEDRSKYYESLSLVL